MKKLTTVHDGLNRPSRTHQPETHWWLAFSLMILFIATFLAAGCESGGTESRTEFTDEQYQFYRELAWNFLTDETKATVVSDWEQAKVVAEKYADRTFLFVTLKTEDDNVQSPLVIVINPERDRVVGIAGRS